MSDVEIIEEDEETVSNLSYSVEEHESEEEGAAHGPIEKEDDSEAQSLPPLKPLPPLHRIPKMEEQDLPTFNDQYSYYNESQEQIPHTSCNHPPVAAQFSVYQGPNVFYSQYYAVHGQQLAPMNMHAGCFPPPMNLPPMPKLHPAPMTHNETPNVDPSSYDTGSDEAFPSTSEMYAVPSTSKAFPGSSNSNTSPSSSCSSSPTIPSPLSTTSSPFVTNMMYPAIWNGYLTLKNEYMPMQMHYLFGSYAVASDALRIYSYGRGNCLRFTLRMRLEESHIRNVRKKMKVESHHCTLLGMAGGSTQREFIRHFDYVQDELLAYLHHKRILGVISIYDPQIHQVRYLMHIFPSCDFTIKHLVKVVPKEIIHLLHYAHLLIIIIPI